MFRAGLRRLISAQHIFQVSQLHRLCDIAIHAGFQTFLTVALQAKAVTATILGPLSGMSLRISFAAVSPSISGILKIRNGSQLAGHAA
jgi:hypothetical protein